MLNRPCERRFRQPTGRTMEIFIMQIISASICPGTKIGSASSLLVLNHKEHRGSRKLDGHVGQVDVSKFCLLYFVFIIFTFISFFLFSYLLHKTMNYHQDIAILAIDHQLHKEWLSFRRRQFQIHFSEWICIKLSPKFVPKGPINHIPSLIQIMHWHRPGYKPLSEPMMVRLLTHICVSRPQWVMAQKRVARWNTFAWKHFPHY